jgi:hypothetical protein
MRPIRKVLLYCADHVEAEQLGWILHVRCGPYTTYATTVSSPAAFVREASATGASFDCVVIYRSKLGGEPLMGKMKSADEKIYSLVRTSKSGGAVVEVTNGLLPQDKDCVHKVVIGKIPAAMADVINAVNAAFARKRGPLAVNDIRRGFSLPSSQARRAA